MICETAALLVRRPPLFCVLVVLCFVGCCSPKQVDVTNVSATEPSAAKPSSNRQGNKDSKGGSIDGSLSTLITALRVKYNVERIFAWSGSETDGRIMWSDNKGGLRFINFTKVAGDYRFSSDNESRIADPWGTLLPAATLAPISTFITDVEFPVRVDTLTVGNCTARLILLWHAENRSFTPDRSSDRTLAMPALRVVVSKGDTILSNSINEFECRKPREILVEDMNNDGTKDYCFIGDVAPVVYIWTLSEDCLLQSMNFIEGYTGGSEKTQFLEAKRIDVTKQANSQYLIHAWHKEGFKPQYLEEVYHWSQSERAFITRGKKH